MLVNPRLEPFVDRWRSGKKLVVLTAYDASQAALAEDAGVDLLLVGDSLAMTVQGLTSTASVTLEHMAYHARMVARARKSVPIVVDLPAHTYDTAESAVESSKVLMAAGADAVKLEGNPPGIVAAIVRAGIPVMGHLGLLPQTAKEFKVQGKDELEARRMIEDARSLFDAGCFSIVLECVPLSLAQRMTNELDFATIGIGAGPHTSGQVLVFHDLLGLNVGRKPKFVPQRYADVRRTILDVLGAFSDDVRSGSYPSDEESYH